MEKWKDIPSLEGRYQASSKGRIRSLDTITNNHRQLRKGKIRKLNKDKDGYFHVSIIQKWEENFSIRA